MWPGQPSSAQWLSLLQSKAVVLQIEACEVVSELQKISVQHSINRLEKNRKYRNKCILSKLKTESSAQYNIQILIIYSRVI